jgi:hypothetical protein
LDILLGFDKNSNELIHLSSSITTDKLDNKKIGKRIVTFFYKKYNKQNI